MLRKTKPCANENKKGAAASRLLRAKTAQLNAAIADKETALAECAQMEAKERLQFRMISVLKQTVSFERSIIAEHRKRESTLCDTIRLLRENNEEHLRFFALLKGAFERGLKRRRAVDETLDEAETSDSEDL